MQKKPQNVYMPTDIFLAKVMKRKEGQERSEWVTNFALQLAGEEGNDLFAKFLIDNAVEDMEKSRIKQAKHRAKMSLVSEGIKNPTKQQIEERFAELYGEEETTADGDIREDSQDVTDGSNAALLESGTSANHYGPRQAEARQSLGAGEATPESVSAKTSPALPEKRPHGEFGNVLLTDEEFAKLQEKTTNAWDLITELDQYIESQGKTKKYKSHYATLLNWSRRRETESTPKRGFKTAAEKQRDELQKIADYYASKEVVG